MAPFYDPRCSISVWRMKCLFLLFVLGLVSNQITLLIIFKIQKVWTFCSMKTKWSNYNSEAVTLAVENKTSCMQFYNHCCTVSDCQRQHSSCDSKIMHCPPFGRTELPQFWHLAEPVTCWNHKWWQVKSQCIQIIPNQITCLQILCSQIKSTHVNVIHYCDLNQIMIWICPSLLLSNDWSQYDMMWCRPTV